MGGGGDGKQGAVKLFAARLACGIPGYQVQVKRRADDGIITYE